MKFSELKEYIASDLYRHKGRKGTKAVFTCLRKKRSFKITFWFRLAQYVTQNNYPLIGPLVRAIYVRVCRKYCVDLPIKTKIGKGLLIYHCYGLVIHGDSIIGDNVMLAHQVTLASEKGKAPIIGNRVRITPGAKLVGGVEVGEGSVVGTNAVVVNDVPPNCITVGIPNKIINRPYEDDADRYYWGEKTAQTHEILT